MLSTHTNHEGVLCGLLSGMKNHDWPSSRCDNLANGESDPLPLILRQKLIAYRPILSLVLAPVRMDLSSDFRRKSIGQAFHRCLIVAGGIHDLYYGRLAIAPGKGR
jgi:hypothetical protein